MKTVITIVAVALVSTSAFAANYRTLERDTTLRSDSFATKAMAWEAGQAMLDEVKALPANQLADALYEHTHDKVYNSLRLGDAEVMVEEFSVEKGEVMYRALVNIDYTFVRKYND